PSEHTSGARIWVDVSAHGRSGVLAGRPSSELALQALTGCMDLTGEAGDPPTRAGIRLSELATGAYVAIAVLAALASRSPDPRSFEISAFDTSVAMLSNMASAYYATGEYRSRLGTGHISIF